MSIISKSFKGGYSFKNFEGQPEKRLVTEPLPAKVIIPLAQGFGSALEPSVKVGDNVRAGQILARNDNIVSSPVLASINGTVTSIAKQNYFKREVAMVTIEGDGTNSCKKLAGHTVGWAALSKEQIEELLYTSGVTSLDNAGIPTSFKSSVIGPEQVEDIIIHSAGSEAYNLSPDLLLEGKRVGDFVEGIKILKKIMPGARVHLVLSKRENEALEKIDKLTLNLKNVWLHPVDPKYPMGFDEVLVPMIVGKSFPYGFSAANTGTIVLNLQAVLHVYDAVALGKPLIERTIALCGPGFVKNVHVAVRVGTPLEQLLGGKLKQGNHRIVLNSLLSGLALGDLTLPIDRTCSQLIALPEGNEREFLSFVRPGFRSDSYTMSFVATQPGFAELGLITKKVDTNVHGEERPCIQCGYCSSVCPVQILPTFLKRHADGGVSEKLVRYGIFKCIDCNLCSYVCPSKIPLAKNLKETKRRLLEMGCDRTSCLSPKYDLTGLDEYKGIKVTR